jgi:hypothetical protein
MNLVQVITIMPMISGQILARLLLVGGEKKKTEVLLVQDITVLRELKVKFILILGK